MTRFKVKRPYAEWLDELAHREKVIVSNGIHGIHLAKKIKNQLPPNSMLCTSVAHNRFLLMGLNGKKPIKVETLGNYVTYDI